VGNFQASIGWWMVKSGLESTPHSYNDLPRVSPYRLATHLITAFFIYSLLFSTGLRVLSNANALRLAQLGQELPKWDIPRVLKHVPHSNLRFVLLFLQFIVFRIEFDSEACRLVFLILSASLLSLEPSWLETKYG
jgi:cytochrome c oxidase assembly protein subunit 15